MAQLALTAHQPLIFGVIALLIAVSIAVLLLISQNRGKKSYRRNFSPPSEKEQAKPIFSVCPLCQTKLAKGELIRSARFPGKNFDLIHIFGCPYCYQDHRMAVEKTKRKKRTCPVCLDTLPPGGHLLAEGTVQKGKNHMHIVGCTLCK